jgi:hypothetical protein
VHCRTVWFASTRPQDPAPVTIGGERSQAIRKSPIIPAERQDGFASEDEELFQSSESNPDAAGFADSSGDEAPAHGLDQEPLLDPGARALAMEMEGPSPVDAYAPITMADAPPIAPIDHDGSTIPNEAPTFDGIPDRIDRFVARRTAKAASLPFDQLPMLPILAASLAVILFGLLVARSSVVAAMPQLASLYRSIGVPVNLRGLIFENVKTTQEDSDAGPVFLVEGTITNVAKSTVEVPRLRFAVRNGTGDEVYEWTALPSRSVLGRGEHLPFKTRLASPPSDGREVVARFFNRRDAAAGIH